MLPKLSIKNMSKIINLGEKLITREDYRAIAESLRRYIEESHPAVKAVEKILHNLSPQYRFRII